MQWHIDAWAVWDGAAFISQRNEDASQVEQTVFVSPPEFSPISVARISTAWAAARGHFQERLFGPEDTEVAFSTLAQAIETVRRGFRKGGGDVPGGFLSPTVLPGDEGGDEESGPPFHPFEPEEAFEMSWKTVVAEVEAIELPESRSDLAKALVAAFSNQDLRDAMLKYASDIYASLLRSMFGAHTSSNQVELFDLCRAWRPVFFFTGLSNPKRRDTFIVEFDGRMKKEPVYLQPLHVGIPDGVDWQSESRTLRDGLLAGLLFKLPLAGNWPNEHNASSLGDLLCLLCADRQRLLSEILHVPSFTPALVAALTLALAKVGLPRLVFQRTQSLMNSRIDIIYEIASRWLATALPGRELKGHIAEDIISELNPLSKSVGAMDSYLA